MATYLQGSNKYIPQIQPYQPDFQFYKTVLDTKNAQYEAGYDRVNSIYGTLLNSPLTRQDTSTMRNDFFSKANNEIQRLAGVDLSLEDNQRAAFQVFKPLTTNKLFAKDVNFTKDVYNEYDRAEFFRNCLNEKECGGKYWDGGVQYLQYKAQDFANATEQEAMSMSSPKYVPFVNVVDDAVDFAISSKLEMQTVSSDGKYIYTTTNGTPMELPLYNYFLSKYGNEQQVADMYAVSAYLQRKQYGESKASEFGSAQAAEADYIRQVIDAENKANRENKKISQENKETINAKKEVAEKYIKEKGVDPELDKDFIEYYNRLNDDSEVAEQTDQYYTESLDITSPTSIEGLSQSALAARADAISARSLLSTDLANAASSYAQLTQKQDVKADPIYLENLNFSHQVSLKSMEIQNQWQKAAYDYANDLEKKLWESRLGSGSSDSYTKPLGILEDALKSAQDALNKSLNSEDGSEEDYDEFEDSPEERVKDATKDLYKEQLNQNKQKAKERKENELEFYIHQLRGHGSEVVWNSMGPDKLSILGITDKSQISFLDGPNAQKEAAKEANIDTGENATSSDQSPKNNASVEAPPNDNTADNFKSNIPSTDSTKIEVDPNVTNIVSDSLSKSGNTESPTADNTKNFNAKIPANERYARRTLESDIANTIQTQKDLEDFNAYANAKDAIERGETTGIFDFLGETGKKIQLANQYPKAKQFESILSSMAAENLTNAAEDYTRYVNAGDSLTSSVKDVIRTSSRALLMGEEDESESLFNAIVPYQLIASNEESTAGEIDIESTSEYKNIQLPNENIISNLWNSGLALLGEKVKYRNAVTAETYQESDDLYDAKTSAVDFLIKKYQDKISFGTASEKKSALASIKKMFPGANRLGLIGDDGKIKNNEVAPYMSLYAGSSSNFDKVVEIYSKDPLFKDDVDKATVMDKVSLAMIQSQKEKAIITIDQYNIGKIAGKMETNPGFAKHSNNSTELRDFMNKALFKDLGSINAENSPANGAPLKAVRSKQEFLQQIYSNPKVWEAAGIIADAAITSSKYYYETGIQAANETVKYGYTPSGTYDGVLNSFKSQNKLNPQIAKRLADKTNKLFGMESWDFLDELWNNKTTASNDPADVANTVNRLNQAGYNGKEILKEAIMETWTSEGRTSEWQVYQDYAKIQERMGQSAPYLEFPEIPVIGYDTFKREYGIAAADKNTDLQTYSPRNAIADTYKGQGGITAQPYGINFNEGLDLAVATGNQDFIGLLKNIKDNLASVDRLNAPYNQKTYLLNLPYAKFLDNLNVSDEDPKDWTWDSDFPKLFSGGIEKMHKNNSESILNLLSGIENDLRNQKNIGKFTKLDLSQGQIKTFPVAAGISSMSAYQIIINGERAKSLGYQNDNKDVVITAVIPTSQSNNALYKRTQNFDWVDLALWATGKATVDIPGSGIFNITQDKHNNYVINGEVLTADEINSLISPQRVEPQYASKNTLPGYLFADQLRQQLLENNRYLMQFYTNVKYSKPDLIKQPEALQKRV